MSLETFSDLLALSRQQAEPQRLLLVFAKAELPEDATDAEKAAFETGEGGALAPQVCVDKRPEEIESFEALVKESRETDIQWDILFIAAMAGRGGFPPNSDEAEQPLRMMVESIKSGRISEFLAVNPLGELVQLSRR